MNLQISMLLKNLIKDIPKEKKYIKISGISTNNKDIKKIIFFLLLRVIKIMVKSLLMKLFKKERP